MSDTRFGTVYWSIESVLNGIQAFKAVATDSRNGLEPTNKVRELFEDDDTAHEFEKNLKRVRNILLPFARAIECLESREITPADVYMYWLAVVAQLHDIIIADDKLGKSRYSLRTKEEIRQIANHRFSDLIDNQQSSNVYLAAFFLDPEHRAATIYSNPNPLVIAPVVLSRASGSSSATAQQKAEDTIVTKVGKSLLGILRNEYDWAWYRKEDGSLAINVTEAKEKMKEVNPYLAEYTPKEAVQLLKEQLRAYHRGDPPFNRKRDADESLRDWWYSLRRFREARVLAALCIKIFSTTPTSIVDERAMSIIKWINSSRRNRQLVGTVDDHLAIHTFINMDQTDKRTKPLDVKWRDMKATLHAKAQTTTAHSKEPAGTGEVVVVPGGENVNDEDDGMDPEEWDKVAIPSDRMMHDSDRFELANDFNVAEFRDILSDGPVVRQPQPTPEVQPESSGMGEMRKEDSVVIPDDKEWQTFDL